ncbi:MAG: DNA-binding response regulator [Chloroflexi bacterium HGW-Chloroflexi-5]|jgi:DNA-binding NarL/FixJ family response regulator|nr:MAG: DNA-binding response regulator [Chloroflexi bacterium HGW-Chloroflexi-5]
MKKIRLLLADDHKMVREGLKAFFAPTDDFDVVAEAEDGLEAVENAIKTRPDVILLDLVMPNMDGIEAAKSIKQKMPDAQIIIITSSLEESQVIASIKAGAAGYLLKDSSPLEIEEAIKKVNRGETAFPSRITNIMVKELNKPSKPVSKCTTLTERETAILKLIANGMSNQEIADQLFLSVWTVRTYVTAILDKLEVDNRTQATLYALREGLVKLD